MDDDDTSEGDVTGDNSLMTKRLLISVNNASFPI